MTLSRACSSRIAFFSLVAAAGLITALGCSQKGTESGSTTPIADTPDTIATIGNRFALTRPRIDAIFEELPAEPQAEYRRRGREAFADDLVDRQLLVLDAEDRGLDKETAVGARIDMSRGAILAEALVEKLVREDIAETEATAFYEAHKATDFNRPPTVVLRHIAVTPRPEKTPNNLEKDDATDDTTAQRKITTLLKMVKAGDDFGTLAERFGEDGSAPQGGLLRPFTVEALPKPFSEAIRNLQPGQFTGVVRTEFGYHIVRLEERRAGGVVPYESVKDDVIRTILQKEPDRRRKILDARLTELKKKYPVTYHKERLSATTASSSAAPAPSAQGK